MNDAKDDETELIDVTVTRIPGFYPIVIGEDQYGRNVHLEMTPGEVKKRKVGERFRCRVLSLSLTAKIESRLPENEEPRPLQGPATDERMTLQQAAEVLHVSPAYAQKLAAQGKLGVPAGLAGDAQTFDSKSVARARDALKASQRAGLEKMVDASMRMGLYKDELSELPSRVHQRGGGENS